MTEPGLPRSGTARKWLERGSAQTMIRSWAAAGFLLLAAPLWGFHDPSNHADAKRFGLDRPGVRSRSRWIPMAPQAGGTLGTQGVGGTGAGGAPGLDALAQAERYLAVHRPSLGADPAALHLVSSVTVHGTTHLLFHQFHQGLPVEFARTAVHVSEDGTVLGASSSAEPDLSAVPPLAGGAPPVAETQAFGSVLADLGGPVPPSAGALVVLPVPSSGEIRLAWKFKIRAKGGLWYYYVDAQTGQVLFRYNDLRRQVCGGASGTVQGRAYKVDPDQTPGPEPLAMPDLRVFVADPANSFPTDKDGKYCGTVSGKVFASLRGDFVSVAPYDRPSAHYDNGSGRWFTHSTPSSSPHPYPNSTILENIFAVPTPPPPPAPSNSQVVKVLPHFSSFQVGQVDGDGNVTDDDQVQVLDAQGRAVASYQGPIGAFSGAAVEGASYKIRLTANGSGQQQGFDVDVSSFLVLPDPSTPGPGQSFLWTSTMTFDGSVEQINAYYHVAQMHRYFTTGPDYLRKAPIDRRISVVTQAYRYLTLTEFCARGYCNAHYDPDFQNIFLGDGAPFALDGTAVRHEYVHYVVDRIYPILNFGQSGAMSEAWADYFAAGSFLAMEGIAVDRVGQHAGFTRILDGPCSPTASPNCRKFPNHWTGEIHDDSLMFSQALWQLRQDRIAVLGAANGRACADALAFEPLFYFPFSFREYLEAILQVASSKVCRGTPTTGASNCGPLTTEIDSCGLNASRSAILSAFSDHGISLTPSGGDALEPNDGLSTAVDVTTRPSLTATLFPLGDIDVYKFGAGPGLIEATLTLPQRSDGVYFAYAMRLVDLRNQVVAEGKPPLLTPDASGNCPGGVDFYTGEVMCFTAAPQVRLTHSNTSGGIFYLMVMGHSTFSDSNSGVNSQVPYTLAVQFPRDGANFAKRVIAKFDADEFSFTVPISSYVGGQSVTFSSVSLRDHALQPVPQTLTGVGTPACSGSAPAGCSYLQVLSVAHTSGMIEGRVRIVNDFGKRFPTVGRVRLEIFGTDKTGRTSSLGLSSPVNLTGSGAFLTAFNNIFNPRRGEQAHIHFSIAGAGRVRLRLFTTEGTLVSTLMDQELAAGDAASLPWTGVNMNGDTVASGVYLLHLEAPGVSRTQKIVVVK